MTRLRLLEPEVTLELADKDHVRVLVKADRVDFEDFEIILEDEAFKALSRRRVTLRFNEAALDLSPAAADEPHDRPRT